MRPSQKSEKKSAFEYTQILNAYEFLYKSVLPSILILIGTSVLIGWFLKNQLLVQINPHFAAMKFNTALCFTLTGLSFIFYFFFNKKWVLLTATPILIIGVLTVLEYLGSIRIEIDGLFIPDHFLTKTSHPGRMGLNTATCFSLFGINFLAAHFFFKKNPFLYRLLFFSSGVLILSTGLIALIGYFIGFDGSIGRGSFTLMAIHTAIGMIFTGTLLLQIARTYSTESRTWEFKNWLPIAILLFGFILSLVFKLTLTTDEERTIEKLKSQKAEEIVLHFNQSMTQQKQSFLRMCNRKEAWPEMNRDFWEADATQYYKDFSGIQAIEWINPQNQIEWIYPSKGNEAAIGLNLNFEKNRRDALEAVKKLGIPQATTQIKLVQGPQGFICYYPIGAFPHSGGLIAVVYRTHTFFESMLSRFTNDFDLQILESGKIIYPSTELAPNNDAPFTKRHLFPFTEILSWELQLQPKKAWVKAQTTPLKYLFPLIGMIISILLAGAILFLNEWIEIKNSFIRSSNDHKNLINTMPVGLLILRLPHLEDALSLVLEFANSGAEKALHVSLIHSLEKKFIDIFPNVVEAGLPEIYRNVILSKTPINLGEIVYGDDQVKQSVFSVNAIPYSSDKVAILFENISEQKRVEKDLMLAKESAESANRAKSEFLANMSHEIRTPLNSVIGFSELLRQTHLNEIQFQYVGNINNAGNALLGIINDILDFSKIEAGKLELDLTKIHLLDLIEEVSDVVKFSSSQKQLELLLNLQAQMPKHFLLDGIRTKQVLINLLSNAIKFTQRGEVELKLTFDSEPNHRGTLRFSVRDTGIGISQEQKSKLFKVFSQADSSTTRKYGGTGLGLAISNRLVEKMGGKIQLESELGKGSVFSFSITTEVFPEENEKASTLFQIKKVLVIDDNANNLHILKDTLERWGLQVDCATGCEEALSFLIPSSHYDVLIIDYNMPDKNGFDTIQAIRKQNEIRHSATPVIMLYSSSDDNTLMKQAHHMGIQHFLTKPVKARELLTHFENLNPPKTLKDKTPNERLSSNANPFLELAPKILIVEDIAINLQLVKIFLKNLLPHGIFFEAKNGEEAVAKFQSEALDLIFMDIQMPIMSGLEATEAIRKIESQSNRRIPIVALTAGAVKEEADHCRDAGMDDFLTKPISQPAIKEIIEKYFLI